MCKIFYTIYKDKWGNSFYTPRPIITTGFFLYINNKNIPFNKCLLTYLDGLNLYEIRRGGKIEIMFQNEKKIIIINYKRRIYQNQWIPYTCIEILNEDNIKQFFEIDNNINLNKDKGIIRLQYFDIKKGKELSYIYGKIISIDENQINYTLSPKVGSLGSPIISPYSNSKIIGLHRGYDEYNKFSCAVPIYSIINYIIEQSKDLD